MVVVMNQHPSFHLNFMAFTTTIWPDQRQFMTICSCRDHSELTILSYSHTSNKYISDITEHQIDISNKIAVTITKFKQSQKVLVEEKLIDGKLSLEFSAGRVRLVMNNNIISVNAQDDYYIFTRSLSRKDEIINRIRTFRYEVEKSSNASEEKRKRRSLLTRMEYILTSTSDSGANTKLTKLKTWIIRKKWLFSTTSPFVMKIIDLIEYMMKYSQ